MSGSEQVMAVLLEEDDLRLVHRDWPSKMRLAVCLMPSGDCQLLLFRQEEAGIFAQRLRKHLGLRSDEICIYPPVSGFPSRQLRYSDERSLAALLADSPQLVEDATDYSVNFAFALEEGLDPVEFLGVEAEVVVEPVVAATPVVQNDGALQFSSRRAVPAVKPIKPAVRKLTFDLAREAARIAEGEGQSGIAKPEPVQEPSIFPGEAFKPITEFDEPEVQGYQLTEEDTCFVISNGTGPTAEIDNASGLFLRDDRQLLAIRINNMGHPPPNTLRLHTEILPKSLKAALRAACGSVDLTVEAPFVYVALPEVAKPAAAPKAEAVPEKPAGKQNSLWKSTKRRRFVRVASLVTVTALAIALVLGSQPAGVLNQSAGNGPIDWSQFRLSMDGSP